MQTSTTVVRPTDADHAPATGRVAAHGDEAAPGPAVAVVADVHHRSGVAGLRALGKAGLGPIAVGRAWTNPGVWSRYASARAVIPGGDDERGLAATLEGLSAIHGPVVPYPGTEETIDAVVDAAATTPGVVAPFPVPAVLALRRKSNLRDLDARSGPRAGSGEVTATAAELRGASPQLPCAIKTDQAVGALGRTHIVTEREEYEAVLDAVPVDEPLIVQPLLEGPLMCVAVVLDRSGDLVSAFQYEVASTWPAEAGPAARAVSVLPNRDLVARVAALLRDAGYWGLAQVDFMGGADAPTVIDANPRFFPAIALATSCGADLAAAWHAVVLGEAVGQPAPYRVGMTYRWLEADVLAALRGRPRRLLEGTPDATTGAMWDADDPVAGLLLATDAVASRPARLATAVARGRGGRFVRGRR